MTWVRSVDLDRRGVRSVDLDRRDAVGALQDAADDEEVRRAELVGRELRRRGSRGIRGRHWRAGAGSRGDKVDDVWSVDEVVVDVQEVAHVVELMKHDGIVLNKMVCRGGPGLHGEHCILRGGHGS